MIEGAKIKKLKVIPDERGRLMEIIRSDDDLFIRFGQVYLTSIYPGVVKAWHYHKKQTDNLTVISGMAKLVLYDARKDSSTYNQVQEFFMGRHNPLLVQIPNMVYHGFKGIGVEETLILNCPTEVYHYDHPDEYRVDPHQNDIPYDWARKDG
ncbi:MAG: dTDP-4-dehydrorhamnose 3,5-epimerase family protein [bacterium]|nr:dTDP-4-dehydrorhamnose 3,5-epimerase family protein [bacterium]